VKGWPLGAARARVATGLLLTAPGTPMLAVRVEADLVEFGELVVVARHDGIELDDAGLVGADQYVGGSAAGSTNSMTAHLLDFLAA
jgi:hypothetical protein